MEAAAQHEIRDEQLLVVREVLSAQGQEMTVPQLTKLLNMHLKLLPFHRNVLEQLHDHHAVTALHVYSQAALAEHLGQSLQ